MPCLKAAPCGASSWWSGRVFLRGRIRTLRCGTRLKGGVDGGKKGCCGRILAAIVRLLCRLLVSKMSFGAKMAIAVISKQCVVKNKTGNNIIVVKYCLKCISV